MTLEEPAHCLLWDGVPDAIMTSYTRGTEMNVKELIEILQEFPEDLEVVGQWRDVEYGLDISQDIDVYKSTVQKTPGLDHYTLGALTQYATDVEVLIIDV